LFYCLLEAGQCPVDIEPAGAMLSYFKSTYFPLSALAFCQKGKRAQTKLQSGLDCNRHCEEGTTEAISEIAALRSQ